MSYDPMNSPTQEEIDEHCRAVRRKFSNRFVPMDKYQSVWERAEALDAELATLRAKVAALQKLVDSADYEGGSLMYTSDHEKIIQRMQALNAPPTGKEGKRG